MLSTAHLRPWIRYFPHACFAVFLFCGVQFALYTRAYRAPDERMHVAYIKSVVDGQLPVLGADRSTHEAHQPPLYYVALSPIYRAGEWLGDTERLWLLRIVSLALASSVIMLVWQLSRLLWPEEKSVAMLATGLTALNPQFIFISGVVNNDALANAFGALLLLLIARAWLAPPATRMFLWYGGLAAAMAFLTKLVLWPLAALLLLLLIFRVGKNQKVRTAVVALPAVMALGWWTWRNFRLYGDLTGAGFMRELWYDEQHKDLLAAKNFKKWWATLHDTFWARFGLFTLALKSVWYKALRILVIVGGIGALFFLWRNWKTVSRERRGAWLLMAGAVIMTLAGIFTYSLTFFQPQGRYLFPVIGAINFFLAAGLLMFVPTRWRSWVTAAALLFFSWLDWQSLQLIISRG